MKCVQSIKEIENVMLQSMIIYIVPTKNISTYSKSKRNLCIAFYRILLLVIQSTM